MNGPRAIIAVIALYAFALQGFLGNLMPPVMGADGHVLCLSGSGLVAGDPAPDRPAPHSHADCCTAAHVAAAVVAPGGESATIAWPPRRAARVAFATHPTNGPRAPPGSIAHPRGPPVL
ncbi:hypothetical protein [uncultured Methylobacterium sp.]|uniref:hypothetical protein n=1 Tax=uncultured Methylobacterium sp. TaxID=157278 RepID=UPI0035CB4B2E